MMARELSKAHSFIHLNIYQAGGGGFGKRRLTSSSLGGGGLASFRPLERPTGWKSVVAGGTFICMRHGARWDMLVYIYLCILTIHQGVCPTYVFKTTHIFLF